MLLISSPLRTDHDVVPLIVLDLVHLRRQVALVIRVLAIGDNQPAIITDAQHDLECVFRAGAGPYQIVREQSIARFDVIGAAEPESDAHDVSRKRATGTQ